MRRLVKLGLVGVAGAFLLFFLFAPIYTLSGSNVYSGPQLVTCGRPCIIVGITHWSVTISPFYHFFGCGVFFNSHVVVTENPTANGGQNFTFNHPSGWYCGAIPTDSGTSP